MGGASDWKRRMAAKSEMPASAPTDESVRRQLAFCAGTEDFRHRDPIYHLTESFRTTFDMMGQQRAAGSAPNMDNAMRMYMTPGTTGISDGKGITADVPGVSEASGSNEGGSDAATGGGLSGEFLSRTSMDPMYKTREQKPGSRLLNKFAEVSFNRGVMAGAVLQGQGKMMLFSCLKRTVCQSSPQYLRERALFQAQSVHRHVPRSRGDISITNRGFTDSAVGLVVDVLKDARQVVDSMTKMAEGSGLSPDSGGLGTMHRMYPFLTDSRERGLLEEYRARLREPGLSGQERDVLQRAIVSTEAIIAKKDQMKRDFIQKLRYISYSAASAAAEFSQEEFRQDLIARLEKEADELPPPDDGDGGSGDGDGDENGGAPDSASTDAKGGKGRTE